MNGREQSLKMDAETLEPTGASDLPDLPGHRRAASG